jgi:hypothetical protein
MTEISGRGAYMQKRIRETIKDVDGLDISAADRTTVYEGNARRLLRL